MKAREFIKKEWLQILILAVPFVFLIFFWDRFPQQIPTHWNLKGQVDDYSSKTFGLLLAPVMNVFICCLFFVLPKIDPRGKNYDLFKGPFKIVRISITLFVAAIFFVIAFVGLGHKLSVAKISLCGVILLMLVMGNYIGNVKPNWFVGIRTPWTLDNPEVWRKTHRMAGKLWVASSAVMLLLGIIVPIGVFGVLFFIYIITFIALIPAVYSYLLFRRGAE